MLSIILEIYDCYQHFYLPNLRSATNDEDLKNLTDN